MHLLVLFGTLFHAAEPPICSVDLSETSLNVRESPLRGPRDLASRAIRPGLLKTQEDTCRCLPNLRRNRPSRVKAMLHIEPNEGTMRMKYTVEPVGTPPIGRMLECLGEPELTFEPMHYVSDMIYSDGSRASVIRYPVLLELDNERPRKASAQRKK